MQNSHNYVNQIPNPEYKIILFCKYINLKKEELEILKASHTAFCEALCIKGRMVLAEEGINATLEGKIEDIEKYKKFLLNDKYFKKINIKESVGTGDAFPKLSVKIKDEIVSTKLPKNIDPRIQTGIHLSPVELKRWYKENQDFVIFDMRNDYEIASGYFEKTINLESPMKASRELPELIKKYENLKDKKVLTVCTGGVRCEKMSACLLDAGFKNVYQLENGMHSFMEKYPGEHFKGTLFTFDNRMTMHFGGEREIVGECYFCKSKTENYGHCNLISCHKRILICENCNTKESFCSDVCKNSFEVKSYLNNN